MLGKRAPQFITSVLQITASNEMLAKADPMSIYNSAAVAATLDLPLNNNLGFAYIVPYNAKQKDGSYKVVAQFQMGYKGFIQLAQRSGQFKTISAAPIYEGQLVEMNPLTGFVFDFSKKGEKIVGYAAYFSLINGFEKTFYMTVEEVNKHAGKFSQTFKKGFGLWKDEFESMATKTVLKLLLSKFAPLSVEMQKAVLVDQGIIKDENANQVEYADHEDVTIDKEAERVTLMITDAKTPKELTESMKGVTLSPDQTDMFNQKMTELNGR
jgi:recombination protein RecT